MYTTKRTVAFYGSFFITKKNKVRRLVGRDFVLL